MRRAVPVVVVAMLFAALLVPPGNGSSLDRTLEGPRTESRSGFQRVAGPGVNRTTIKIGLHAPLTGASPLPSDSAERGKDLYFRWRAANGHDINRRRTGILPTLRYRPGDHFGGAGAHLLRISCVDERWHTVRAFVRDF